VQKFRLCLRLWLPVLVWMTLVFSFSADGESNRHSSRFFEPILHWLFPQMPSAQVEAIHHLIRKCGHLTEYAILALLLWRAIRQSAGNLPRPWHWGEVGLTLACVWLYAAGDELHQVFVPGRTGQVSDVFIDTAGGALALLALWLGRRFMPNETER
jgi:VanZ family protein